jgi:hypothetical protein
MHGDEELCFIISNGIRSVFKPVRDGSGLDSMLLIMCGGEREEGRKDVREEAELTEQRHNRQSRERSRKHEGDNVNL